MNANDVEPNNPAFCIAPECPNFADYGVVCGQHIQEGPLVHLGWAVDRLNVMEVELASVREAEKGWHRDEERLREEFRIRAEKAEAERDSAISDWRQATEFLTKNTAERDVLKHWHKNHGALQPYVVHLEEERDALKIRLRDLEELYEFQVKEAEVIKARFEELVGHARNLHSRWTWRGCEICETREHKEAVE